MLSTTVLLRTGLPKTLLTGHICDPEQPFAAGNWSQDLLLKFFDVCNFLPKKLFLPNLLTLVFYINFNH